MAVESVLYAIVAVAAVAWLWDALSMYFRPQRKLGPPLLTYQIPFGLDMIYEATYVHPR
jgi:hypothetical protein